MKNDNFWSEIGSGFEEPSGTPPPRIPRSIHPGKLREWLCKKFQFSFVLTEVIIICTCTLKSTYHEGNFLSYFLSFYFVSRYCPSKNFHLPFDLKYSLLAMFTNIDCSLQELIFQENVRAIFIIVGWQFKGDTSNLCWSYQWTRSGFCYGQVWWNPWDGISHNIGWSCPSSFPGDGPTETCSRTHFLLLLGQVCLC